jgi:hypothetical protein
MFKEAQSRQSGVAQGLGTKSSEAYSGELNIEFERQNTWGYDTVFKYLKEL